MKTFQKESLFEASHPLYSEVFTEASIFFDIETTGFAPGRTFVYLIGCASRRNNIICTSQFFAENPQDEELVIRAFLALLKQYKTIITFNGIGFDMSYLRARCNVLGIQEDFSPYICIDIYKSLSGFKKILKLNNLKQKTLETFLDLNREDAYSGGELINIYLDYVKTQDSNSLSVMRLHNLEDVMGMIGLLPIFAYVQLFQGNFTVRDVDIQAYEEYEGKVALELMFSIDCPYAIPKRFSYGLHSVYISGFQNSIKLKVKIYQGELKFFYSNYKDYYYLPDEDEAIHKSVAFYVDKNFRTQAKAANCYSKRTGCFLPQYKEIFTPYFKLEYNDKHAYFEMTDEFTDSIEAQKKYLQHLLWYMLEQK
ncbi:ribonuclease H-like domain-containing protein [Lachnospiraceae bacterium ZAX-1]